MSQTEQHIPCGISYNLQKISVVSNHLVIFEYLKRLLAACDSLCCLRSRCRLSCDGALAHPWMASFTPLSRRPTKSLNKEKMRRFLAKRKWKVTAQKNAYNAVSQTFNACIIYNQCFVMMTFLNPLSFVDLKLGYVCNLSSSAICPFKLAENWQGCLGPTADG